MDNNDLVTICVFDDATRANIVKSKIESEGISCVITDENIGSMNFLYSAAVGGVKLQVLHADREAAMAILSQFTGDQENDSAVCRNCLSKNTQHEKTGTTAVSATAILMLGLPLMFPVYQYRCNNCGNVWKDSSAKFIQIFRIAIFLCVLMLVGAVVFVVL